MKNKLSALKYVLNNRRQVFVITIALALTFMATYVINFMFMAENESIKPVFIEQPKKVAYVKLSKESMGIKKENYENEEAYEQASAETFDNIIERLREHEGISDAIYAQTFYASYYGLVGQATYEFPLLEKTMIPKYLEHMGARLVEGRLPENDGEILVDKTILKNQKMEIGDYYMEEANDKNFTVVGVLESDNMTMVGTPRGYYNTGNYIVVMCDEKNADMKKVFADIGIELTENDSVFDIVDWKEKYDRDVVGIINAAFFVILLVVTIFLAISLIVAYISFMRSRVNEYCLYNSIGFSRIDVYGMIMRELGIIFGAGIVLGALACIAIMNLIGQAILTPIGLIYKFFYPEYLVKILAAFVAVIGILQIPILVTVNKIKTIDMIEE